MPKGTWTFKVGSRVTLDGRKGTIKDCQEVHGCLWIVLDDGGTIWEYPEKLKHLRGFALMSKAKRRQIGSLGGCKTQGLGKGHRWTKGEAVIAGRRGAAAKYRKEKQ